MLNSIKNKYHLFLLKTKLFLSELGFLSPNKVYQETTLDIHSNVNKIINNLNKKDRVTGLSQEEIRLHGALMDAQDALADCYDLINRAFPEEVEK